MAIDTFQPDRTVADRRIKVGCGGKAAQAPFFLIPSSSDDPAPVRIFGGIFANGRLRFGKAVGCR